MRAQLRTLTTIVEFLCDLVRESMRGRAGRYLAFLAAHVVLMVYSRGDLAYVFAWLLLPFHLLAYYLAFGTTATFAGLIAALECFVVSSMFGNSKLATFFARLGLIFLLVQVNFVFVPAGVGR